MRTAQYAIQTDSADFEAHFAELWTRIGNALWRSDEHVVRVFQ